MLFFEHSLHLIISSLALFTLNLPCGIFARPAFFHAGVTLCALFGRHFCKFIGLLIGCYLFLFLRLDFSQLLGVRV